MDKKKTELTDNDVRAMIFEDQSMAFSQKNLLKEIVRISVSSIDAAKKIEAILREIIFCKSQLQEAKKGAFYYPLSIRMSDNFEKKQKKDLAKMSKYLAEIPKKKLYPILDKMRNAWGSQHNLINELVSISASDIPASERVEGIVSEIMRLKYTLGGEHHFYPAHHFAATFEDDLARL